MVIEKTSSIGMFCEAYGCVNIIQAIVRRTFQHAPRFRCLDHLVALSDVVWDEIEAEEEAYEEYKAKLNYQV